ncbi:MULTISPECIES: hypothetical protein [Pseudomonas]|uniref:hypothetical protein n=1 Tax=Pseudomonas TaxID=286 RepID=UPI0009DFE02C|nr:MULTISPECIES: hypothetical protein [Pseudomonas]PRA56827.1 hypothetical protein CQZ98_08185 [Pseudomonas sp. MYb115]QXN47568.1 hypothetical protein KW062_14700 [Pseudomonas fluorescens]WSO21870.1 hypothetical protein VUJ50_14790 [Pseudomonas fluorescens]
MNLISTLIPGSRAFIKALRIKPCREPTLIARPLCPPSPLRLQPRLRGHWRVCPVSGQRQQRWGYAASLEPPSRYFARLLQPPGLGRGARTFS